MKKTILSLFFSVSTIISLAQTISNFALKNVMDNSTVNLSDFSSGPGIVLVFTSVACPFDGYYTNRLKLLQAAYADRLPVILVNSYTESPEGEEWMTKSAVAAGLTLPYLADKEQALMTQLGAQRSPEAFLLKNVNNQFTVVYHGAIDDNAQVEAGVKTSFLKDAIEASLAGRTPATTTSRPVGCYIRKK
jgi:peroxiredoxin